MADKRDVPVKVPDDVLSGVYSNQMVVRHTSMRRNEATAKILRIIQTPFTSE